MPVRSGGAERGGSGRGGDDVSAGSNTDNRNNDTRHILNQQDVGLAVNAFLVADKTLADGGERALKESRQHLATIQSRYWRNFYALLSAVLAKRRSNMNFTDDERLFMDLGLVDARMVDADRPQQAMRELVEEVNSKGMSGCYYLSEWLMERQTQLQLENAISNADEGEDNTYESQLKEARRRVLSRLSGYFTGLPGIPLEVSESMRSGDLDRVIIASGITAMRQPTRKNFLRRHHLWALREQILTKARARASGQAALKLFEMLNEVYARDWRARFDAYQADIEQQRSRTLRHQQATSIKDHHTVSVTDPNVDTLMSEARQMRMRSLLMGVIDGKSEADTVLHGRAPRVTKKDLAEFLPVVQAFDRTLVELPPIVIVPGSGRGIFAWETGCVLLALRPMVGIDDSVATAFALLRMLDDRLNNGGVLRQAYEKKFPGAVFQNEFPADYRAWLTRLTKGDIGAMNPQRRAFFRDVVGPDVSGPLLPPNLRNVGPQTMVAICRRLEKQVAADDSDANLHRRLAAIYWQQGNMEAAGLQFNAAMQSAPNDGETLFAAGMFMRAQGDLEAANDCFRWGKERAAASMWGIYCQDALANQL